MVAVIFIVTLRLFVKVIVAVALTVVVVVTVIVSGQGSGLHVESGLGFRIHMMDLRICLDAA